MKIKSKKILLALLVSLVLVTIVPAIAEAFTWKNYLTFTVTDTGGTARTNIPVLTGIVGQNLINSGYINATGTDAQIMDGTTASIFSTATTDTPVFVPTLAALQSRTYKMYTGISPVQTTYPIITGGGGYITVVDDASIELGNSFNILVKGFIDTGAGANKDIIYKPNGVNPAFRLYISGASTITADINNGTKTVSAAAIATGLHTVRVKADTVNVKIWVDDTLKGTTALAGASVPDTADNWILTRNDVMPYITFIKIGV